MKTIVVVKKTGTIGSYLYRHLSLQSCKKSCLDYGRTRLLWDIAVFPEWKTDLPNG